MKEPLRIVYKDEQFSSVDNRIYGEKKGVGVGDSLSQRKGKV